MQHRRPRLDAEYLLPLKWAEDTGLDELVEYLELLSTHLRVLVVDGSGDELYARHEQAFPAGVFHCRPRHPECGNGKVDGVLTGVDLAEAQQLIIADDDVRLFPVLCWSARRPLHLAALAASVTAAAEYGRRRDGGRRVWGPASPLWAPLWLVERAVCVWLAVQWRLRGGIPYSGVRLKTAAHSVRRIRRSLRG